MVDDKEIRRVNPGWQVVWFIDCDTFNGRPNHATADQIVKNWYPTQKEAERA